ncbi:MULTISPECIES: ChrR family anti-sigma-E factor [Pseudoalteromonas]|uniref:ChrR family anti-sigma-E factor n=1 Tax=Pseudoalteromonas obscura TaxID=3048491 RepID=A0ABT7EQQ0_9GAMM|nr:MULTISPECIES: ChrR family anti-sigma-E factor [Pseudoalteromonas]MBQ4835097.1 ChrR family anti-sigma-E factor [Pseudoalteromonas luteoviolacea]MDK2597390.1 ChrR family anti-sigma-E factor [Pseudoalteromonas sp. P94(2023)]
MIKYHPSKQLMQKHVAGELPVGLSVAIAAHIELCGACKLELDALESKQAEAAFTNSGSYSEEAAESSTEEDLAFEAMMNDITQLDMSSEMVPRVPQMFDYQDKSVQLPRAIAALKLGSFINAGKVSRARFELDEGPLRSSLLHIKPGGEIPEHTHTGFELTLLLDGSFEDESGSYVPGDFIMLDGRHNHTPKTEEGCLCFTLVDSALHFNKGLSKLLNPIGNLIY